MFLHHFVCSMHFPTVRKHTGIETIPHFYWKNDKGVKPANGIQPAFCGNFVIFSYKSRETQKQSSVNCGACRLGKQQQTRYAYEVLKKTLYIRCLLLNKNLNSSRPSEDPPVRGENVKTFRGNHRLQR